MHSLNPFLRAFFRSSLPSQCTPVNHHILLVPTTDVILSSKDRESNAPYVELVGNEDFLSSHILKIAASGHTPTKDVGSFRENRAKARQFSTFNGRTVVIKESFVYSNKGFRNLNQAQLLSDSLYYQDGLESQEWLIYYISKPLIGTLEPIEIPVPTISKDNVDTRQAVLQTHAPEGSRRPQVTGSSGRKEMRSFRDVLAGFPLIARQMQSGLEQGINEFAAMTSKAPVSSPSGKRPSHRRRSSSLSVSSSTNGSVLGGPSHAQSRRTSISSLTLSTDDEETNLRKALETAVMGAIDLFQSVDKQQLSLLGATTELTGPVVERFIERYVVEQLHHSVLYPRISSIYRLDDLELESCVRRMSYIDVSQVGIDIQGGRQGKNRMIARLNDGIQEFQKLSTASSAQAMLDILVETQKIVTLSTSESPDSPEKSIEKPAAATMNADTLVSLLLIVVIRSHVRQLQAKLAYMRGFILIDDVESGEMGYALSTFEAVLSYLANDSGGLRTASRRNKRLWEATKSGNLSEMRTILEPDGDSFSDEPDSTVGSSAEDVSLDGMDGEARARIPGNEERNRHYVGGGLDGSPSNLSHVFPFQQRANQSHIGRPKPVKRVSIDLRSLSSDISFNSRTSTITSATSAIEGDTSIDKLCQTLDLTGSSVLMIAVESSQPEALDYLLSLEDYFPVQTVLEDTNSNDATLLSTALQMSNQMVIQIIVDYVLSLSDERTLRNYARKADKDGRTFAHYLFQAPHLISKLGGISPWRHRDKNGQTPLLALCRSYDHPRYLDMVNAALRSATEEQGDGKPLHLDNHVDGKGNTILHAVNDPMLARKILQHCDTDPNAQNEKLFTPLMFASKYGRFELVRTLFLDERIDIQAKEYRGMTAIELAKDEDLRNRMDDMLLVSNTPSSDGRVTAVVRSFFVEDATIRLIIKTATRNNDGLITVSTCRRSLADFENLARWLAIEHPASWLPSIFNFRSPFQIPSKPSRAVLHDIQLRLDKFLQIMLSHSTFSTHELLWEFILVPDLQLDQMAQRSLLKADIRQEKIRDDYAPLVDYKDVESFVTHARESIRAVHHSTRSSLRRVNSIRNVSADLYTSLHLASRPLSSLQFVPIAHLAAFSAYTRVHRPPESDPYKFLHADLLAISSTFLAMLSSLSRPHALISTAQDAQKSLDRHRGSLRRSDRWPLGLLEETRKQAQLDAQGKMAKTQEDLRIAGCELHYTQQVVASELAGWQEQHVKMTTRAVRRLARRVLIREKDRLEGMKRALRPLTQANVNAD